MFMRLTARCCWFFSILCVAQIFGSLPSSHSQTDDDRWRQFRGTEGQGRSDATGLPTTWGDSENIVWKAELPGPGASSPVMFENRIYLTCYTGYGVDANEPGNQEDLLRHLVCLDRSSGKLLWEVSQKSTNKVEPYKTFIPLHGYTSGTPAVDETGIYVFYGSTGAAAYGHDGKQRWLVNCGTKHHMFGTSNSPILYKDLVIINAGVESGDLIGLDKKTGAEKWRRPGMKESWNTPTLVQTADGKTELAVNTKGTVYGIDPATGEVLWTCEGIDDYICPSILAEGEMLYAIGGRQNTAIAIRSGGRGDVTESHVVWRIREGSNVCSPVYLDGHLYWTTEKSGIACCVDAVAGKVVYKKRLRPAPDLLYASPLVADGKVYLVSRAKGTFVLAAKPEFELLAHNLINDDESTFNGSPIVSDGKIILRSDKFLYAIGMKTESE